MMDRTGVIANIAERGAPAGLEAREPGVSIVIANWNHRIFLPRALRSALDGVARSNDAGFPGEVIVIDDASRDGSTRLLRSALANSRGPYLRVVELARNIGLPGVRNLGLHLARYRYVCPLDADNEIVAANLPVFLQAISDTGASLVYGNLVERKGTAVRGLRSNEVATLRLTVGNYIDALSLIDADRVEELGGYTTDGRLHGWEDWELLLHLIAEEHLIVFVPIVFGHYYLNPDSMIEETDRLMEERTALLRRMYWQTGVRAWDRKRIGRIYHPTTGYLDEWR